MAVKARDTETVVIDAVCDRVRDRLPDEHAVQCEAFVREYYAGVPVEELEGRSALDLYGIAVGHWKLARHRQAGEVKLRVFNPQFERDGWQSTHTVIEVVTDDMPFIVDSASMEVGRQGYGIHAFFHPILRVRRDAAGTLEGVGPATASDGDGIAEAILHIEVDRETDEERLEALAGHLRRVLREVRAAVEDWQPMRTRLHDAIAELAERPAPVDAPELAEAKAFLEWLDDNHFTFLGYRAYELVMVEGVEGVRAGSGSGLGILRQPAGTDGAFRPLPENLHALAHTPDPLVLAKANARATVHRPSRLDYVGVKRFDEQGRVVGEHRFLGLYTTVVQRATPHEIPTVRGKVDAVERRAAFVPDSHAAKALDEILEDYPRDELFQISEDELFEIAMGILALGERQRVRLFVREDPYERFLTCLVFIPRDRFNTGARERAATILREAFSATELDWTLRLSESVLARLYYVVHIEPGRRPSYDASDIELRLVQATRAWVDDLRDELVESHGEARGNALFRRYEDAFPPAYQADWVARAAVADIDTAEGLRDGDPLAMTLYEPLEAQGGVVRCKLFKPGAPLSLSDVLPLFEHMGATVSDERPYEVLRRDAEPLWIYDFGLECRVDTEFLTERAREIFQEAFIDVWTGAAEDDGFNGLVLRAELTAREVTILRAAAKYLRQAGTAFSDGYMERTLTKHPVIARLLVGLFRARLNPQQSRDPDGVERIEHQIDSAIDAVESLDEDRMLRNFLDVVRATIRTNFFQRGDDGRPRSHLSLKLDPALIALLPAPRPKFEIFVYSPRVEGVHLRGGKVARGGLRWSDRREDFRTEVLGLMKAQMVKNALIVPVGAKGGFVVKRPPAGPRAALREEVVACYRAFICGLLEVTDNIVDGRVVGPRDVVRYDGDDPYLVVAADKGTATFSDIANVIAAEYDFWLGDAFASGGSAGYDHKRMGITARGAWESVKRHFRELGTDIQTTDFTVVGIGDMSGDVFGNGMLLSPHIRLVAAFNHQHIFLDPTPDAASSYAERRRLFDLEQSSWLDYDASLLSDGGGIYARTAKSIRVSEQARAALGIEGDGRMTPNDLMRGILLAPVDLLWNGGIGTYVKCTTETHAEAGDKANDAVRVDGARLRCRVVGEGGNLGLTQRARVEYALTGGRINTDAIDNAGGVNCSDHEVNIKILLDAVVAAGDLTTKQRNTLLAEMTEAVGDRVVRGNYDQTLALSLGSAQAGDMVNVHARLIGAMEQSGQLDRALEALPSDDAIAERKLAGRGLTAPELAVVLAYSKIWLYAELLDSDVPEDAYLSSELARYFPAPLPERFAAQMHGHRLRREIIATQVTNSLVDRAGSTFVFRLREETGAPPSEIARAYAAAREIFAMPRLWADVEALDNHAAADAQIAMLFEGRKLVERAARWLVRNRRRPIDVAATVAQFSPAVTALAGLFPGVLEGEDREAWDATIERLTGAGIATELATRVAGLSPLFSALDIAEVAEAADRPIEHVAPLYFRLGSRLQLPWLRERIVELPRPNRWQGLARAALRQELYTLHRALTWEALATLGAPAGAGPADEVDDWAQEHAAALERCLSILADIRAARTYDVTTLTVALREVRNLLG